MVGRFCPLTPGSMPASSLPLHLTHDPRRTGAPVARACSARRSRHSVRLLDAREVVTLAYTRSPGAPAPVVVFNLRGTVLPRVEARPLLGRRPIGGAPAVVLGRPVLARRRLHRPRAGSDWFETTLFPPVPFATGTFAPATATQSAPRFHRLLARCWKACTPPLLHPSEVCHETLSFFHLLGGTRPPCSSAAPEAQPLPGSRGHLRARFTTRISAWSERRRSRIRPVWYGAVPRRAGVLRDVKARGRRTARNSALRCARHLYARSMLKNTTIIDKEGVFFRRHVGHPHSHARASRHKRYCERRVVGNFTGAQPQREGTLRDTLHLALPTASNDGVVDRFWRRSPQLRRSTTIAPTTQRPTASRAASPAWRQDRASNLSPRAQVLADVSPPCSLRSGWTWAVQRGVPWFCPSGASPPRLARSHAPTCRFVCSDPCRPSSTQQVTGRDYIVPSAIAGCPLYDLTCPLV